MILKLIRNSTE